MDVFVNRGLTAADIPALAPQLATARGVDLSLNDSLGDEGVVAVLAALSSDDNAMSPLEHLCLASCDVTDRALEHLAQACSRLPFLRVLNLSWNPLMDVRCLAQAMGMGDNNLAWLERLDLSYTGVENEGVLHLIDALSSSNQCVLRTVRLEGNYISRRVVRQLRFFLGRNRAKSGLLVLRSAQEVPRVGTRSCIARLPRELVRMVSLNLI